MSMLMRNAEENIFLSIARDFINEKGYVIMGINPAKIYDLMQHNSEDVYSNEEKNIYVKNVYLDADMKFRICSSMCDYFISNWSLFYIYYTSVCDSISLISRLIRVVFSGIFGNLMKESIDKYSEDDDLKTYLIYRLKENELNCIEDYVKDVIIPYFTLNEEQIEFEKAFYNDEIVQAVYNLQSLDINEINDSFEKALSVCDGIRLKYELLNERYPEEVKPHIKEIEIIEKIIKSLDCSNGINQSLYYFGVHYVGIYELCECEMHDKNAIILDILDSYARYGRLLTVSVKTLDQKSCSVRVSVYVNEKEEINTYTFIVDVSSCDDKISSIASLVNRLLSEHWEDLILEESNDNDDFVRFMNDFNNSMDSSDELEDSTEELSKENEDEPDTVEEVIDFDDMSDKELLKLTPSQLFDYFMNKGYHNDDVSDNTMDLISYAKKMCEEFTRKMNLDKKGDKSE